MIYRLCILHTIIDFINSIRWFVVFDVHHNLCQSVLKTRFLFSNHSGINRSIENVNFCIIKFSNPSRDVTFPVCELKEMSLLKCTAFQSYISAIQSALNPNFSLCWCSLSHALVIFSWANHCDMCQEQNADCFYFLFSLRVDQNYMRQC